MRVATLVLLGFCLLGILVLALTSRRAATAPAPATPHDLLGGLPFQHGPKVRRQMRDLSSLADPGSGGPTTPAKPPRADELVEVQPGEGPVSVSGPGGVTGAERYPSARVIYVTTAEFDVTSEAPRPPEPETRSTDVERPTGAPRSSDPDRAFDPPGQYR